MTHANWRLRRSWVVPVIVYDFKRRGKRVNYPYTTEVIPDNESHQRAALSPHPGRHVSSPGRSAYCARRQYGHLRRLGKQRCVAIGEGQEAASLDKEVSR